MGMTGFRNTTGQLMAFTQQKYVGCNFYNEEQGWNDSPKGLALRELSVQFSSVSQLCLTLCDPMDCSMPGFSVHCKLLELAQTPVQ